MFGYDYKTEEKGWAVLEKAHKNIDHLSEDELRKMIDEATGHACNMQAWYGDMSGEMEDALWYRELFSSELKRRGGKA